MKHIVIGYGEIGQAVGLILGRHDVMDLTTESVRFHKEYDCMHVCIPYSSKFVKIVKEYRKRFNPRLIVIYSTVAIGTTRKIEGAVHSPIEGVHPELEMSIRFMERWVGYNDKDTRFAYRNMFSDLGLRVKLVPGSEITEALKLLSTTEYGVNIAFADYKAKLAKSIDMDYKYTQEWNEEYNKLYSNLGMGKKYQKYVLTNPRGKIGGHCVVPNAKILKKIQDHPFLDVIIKMEKK